MKRSKSIACLFFSLVLVASMIPIVPSNAVADEEVADASTTNALQAADDTTGQIVPGDDLDGVKVRFRPAGSYKPVSVEDNGDGDQKDLLLYYLGESTHFRLEKADDDSYKIRFFNDFGNQDVQRKKAQVLDVERNNNDNSTYYREGQNIHMVSGDSNALNKRWRLIQQSDGTYYIQNKLSGLYWSLEDLDKPRSNNNKIIQRKTPLKWEIELVSTSDYDVNHMESIKQYDSLNFSFDGETITSLNWMSCIPDGMPLSDLSIPGTHDSATAKVDTDDKESRRTQQYYIDEMLMAGVRHFDTRLGWEHSTLTLVHSDDTDALNHNGQDLTLDEVLQWMTAFLQANPSETIIMQIKADENEKNVETEALSHLGAIAKQENSIIWSGDHVPTLGEARGKIVIISRFSEVSNRDFSMGDGTSWALDVGGWRQSDTYPAYVNPPGSSSHLVSPQIHSTAQPSGTDNWSNCEFWVQDSYSHTPHETAFKSSKRPYIVGGLDGIVADYFDFTDIPELGTLLPDGTYGAQYRRDQALAKGKNAWVFNYTNCSANGLGYHYRGNAKEIHQWIYDNEWIIRDDMFTGVLANDYDDELLCSTVYRTNFAGGTGGWSDATYEWSADNTTCTATRTWHGAAGYTETETKESNTVRTPATCTEPDTSTSSVTFDNPAFEPQEKIVENATSLGHRWSEGITEIEATCTHDGKITYTCENDPSHKKSEAIPMLPHVPGEPEVIEESGSKYTVITCTECGTELYRDAYVDPNPTCSHASTETIRQTIRNADCTNPELIQEVVKCSECGEVVSSQIVSGELASNHDWNETVYEWNEANQSVTATRTCKRNSSHVETETVPYASNPTQTPTCTLEGSMLYESSQLINEELGNVFDAEGNNLGRISKTETIPVLSHDWGAGAITHQRTCTEDGERTFTCSLCGETKAETLPALGHSWEATYEWAEDGSTCTATQTCMRDDSHHGESATGIISFETTRMPTATEAGMRTYMATFNVTWAETQVANVELASVEEGTAAYLAKSGSSLWEKGTTSTLQFAYERTPDSDATFSHFKGVYVDGSPLAENDFSARSGSVIIELAPAYLNTLSAGSHTIQPEFDDGMGETRSFTIAQSSDPEGGEGGGTSGESGESGSTSGEGGDTPSEGESSSDTPGGNNSGDESESGDTGNGTTDDTSTNTTGQIKAIANQSPTTTTNASTSASPMAKTGDAIPPIAIAATAIIAIAALAIALAARRKNKQ
ncbi:hypothetical protein [Denitrobacterium detoxificans]|jgi:hypothetical protein|uniref:hypothetical protein n=1 Tax=Denitrobacterium detoxificans TaxID=79604 RepID=UPI0026EE758E|nr:hypothetical protein [Denitrobacterium detoxificans]MBE6465493.1 hypothetical protein [Denitrobacterium detoxificans]